MRKHLAESFDEIYILNLGGNVRKNPKLSGSTHNVFGIQIGVSINLFIRKLDGEHKRQATIYYATTEETWRKEEKYHFLEEAQNRQHVSWQVIQPDKKFNWLTESLRPDFEDFLPIGSRAAKQAGANSETIFKQFGLGIKTGRDDLVYDFDLCNRHWGRTSFCDAHNRNHT